MPRDNDKPLVINIQEKASERGKYSTMVVPSLYYLTHQSPILVQDLVLKLLSCNQIFYSAFSKVKMFVKHNIEFHVKKDTKFQFVGRYKIVV